MYTYIHVKTYTYTYIYIYIYTQTGIDERRPGVTDDLPQLMLVGDHAPISTL